MQGQRFKATDNGAPKNGGWRGSQASLDALAANRKPWPGARCRCGLVALKGARTCYKHARGAVLVGRVVSPERQARRELRRRFPFPPGLVACQVFELVRWRLRLAPLALALAQAWDNRANDPLAWTRAVRAARSALEA